MVWLCVVLRVVANPLSNLLQKLLTCRQAAPLWIVGLTHGLLSLVCLPGLLWTAVPVGAEFWWTIGLCVVLAVAGNLLIVQAVRLSDLSLLGPVNAYKAVVSLVPACLLLGEWPTALAGLGLAMILSGSILIAGRSDGTGPTMPLGQLFLDRGVQCRLLALILSATEAVFLKQAVLITDPWTTFAWWSILGFVVLLPGMVVVARRAAAAQWTTLAGVPVVWLSMAATTGIMQFSTLVAFTGMQVAGALALFQTSALLTVLLGWQAFREPHFVRRMVGSSVMVAGAILIIVGKGS